MRDEDIQFGKAFDLAVICSICIHIAKALRHMQMLHAAYLLHADSKHADAGEKVCNMHCHSPMKTLQVLAKKARIWKQRVGAWFSKFLRATAAGAT